MIKRTRTAATSQATRNTMTSQMLLLEPRLVFDGAMVAGFDQATAADDQTLAVTHGGRDAALADRTNDQGEVGVSPQKQFDAAQLVFIDQRLEGADVILAEVDTSQYDVVWLDPAKDGLSQIGAALEQADPVSSLHIITHADDGAVRLGNTLVDGTTFDDLQAKFEAWSDHLTQSADILFYGCDLAESDVGKSLMFDLSEATGAEIAASTDLTGAEGLGGDWDLEFSTGQIEAMTVVDADDMIAFGGVLAAEPQSTIQNIDDPLIGEPFTFTLSFENASSTDTGFAPYVNLIIPTAGTDGVYDSTTEAFTAPPDGVTLDTATYFGQPVETQSAIIVDDGFGGLQVTHPITEEAITINADLGLKAGDTLYVLSLPFGSYTPDQPAANILVTASMSENADLGQPLNIVTNAGFALGNTAVDDPDTDPPIQSATFEASNTQVVSVSPQLYTVETDFSHPGDDTATGPNHVRSMTVTVDVAPGQTLTNADIAFTLPQELVYVSASAAGATFSPPPAQDNGGTDSDDIVVASFANLSGSQTVVINFYVAEDDQTAAKVLDPVTGNDRLIDMTDSVRITGTWIPQDTNDGSATIDTQHSADNFVAKAFDLEKSVTNATDGQNSVGDQLRYTLNLDVSDFFAGDNIVITDNISDGQNFHSGVSPVLTFRNQGGALQTVTLVEGTHFTHDENTGSDYSETLVFDVSAAIDSAITQTRLEGGFFDADTLGGTSVQIVYEATIQDRYADPAGGSDNFLKQNDTLTSGASVTAENLQPNLTQYGSETLDDSAGTSVLLPSADLEISIYAINGSTSGTLSDVRPGDDVTVRLRYDLVSGDFKDFTTKAYLPLPVFSVNDIDADGSNGDAFTEDTDNSIPVVGKFSYGPDAGNTIKTTAALSNSDVSTNTGSNFVQFEFGDLDDAANNSEVIDLLFTVRVNDQPFADGLKLTLLGEESNTNTAGSVAITNQITAITLQQPNIVSITKGVVAVDANTIGESYVGGTPSGVKIAGNTDPNPLTTSVNSTNLGSLNLDSDLSGVDAGDLVRFAIVVENTGSSSNGAFDVTVAEDQLPSGFKVPTGGINLRVVNGAGTGIAIETANPDTALFTPTGIRLQDGATGALAEADPSNGENVLIITYDLEVETAAEANGAFTSTAKLINFAGKEGGADHTVTDLSDDATVSIDGASVTKTIINTSEGGTTGQDTVIGEVVTYEAVVTVPEGTSSSAEFRDTLAEGLAFLDATNITIIASAGLATDVAGGFGNVASNATFSNGGSGGSEAESRRVTLDFGTLTNTNTDNSTAETITIRYDAVVTNDAQNDVGDELGGAVRYSTADETQNISGPEVTVREPTVAVTVTPDVSEADAQDVIIWTVVVTADAASGATAYGVDLTNAIPAGTSYVAASLMSTAGETPANLTESGGTITGNWSSLTPGQTSTFTFKTQVNSTVALGDQITSQADIAWSSLSGTSNSDIAGSQTTVDNERDGSGGKNDYTDSDDGGVTILLSEPVLTVDQTSETSNGTDATVGEIVRYRMVVQIPESTTDDFIVTPDIPDGLQFLNDGTATIAFLSGGGLTSDKATLTGGSLAVAGNASNLAGTDPSFVINSNDIANADGGAFGNGDNPEFNLGRIVNSDDDDDGEYIILEYNTIVVNETGTGGGDTLTSDVDIRSDAAVLVASDSVSLHVVEPALSNLDKAVVSTDGTTATYQITFENSSGQIAHDTLLTDTIGSNLQNLTIVSITGASGLDTSNGTTLNIAFDEIADGDTVTVTYTADIIDDTNIATSTDAVLTWTSLDGDQSSLAGSTAGVAGGTTGERTGDGTGANTYRLTEAAGLSRIAGTLYEDIDQDDQIDGTDPRLGNTDIRITHAGADGNFGTGGDNAVYTLRTDADGAFNIGALPAGNYRIEVVTTGANGLPTGYQVIHDTGGSATDNRIQFTLNEGAQRTGNNFGVLSPNSAPVFSDLGGASPDITHEEGGGPSVLDVDVALSDPELDADALNSWNGATFTVVRNGGANDADIFGRTGTLAPLVEGGPLTVNGTAIGTVSQNSEGVLLLSFDSAATSALVTEAIRGLTYAFDGDNPPSGITLVYGVSDGNTGAQGSGGVLTGSGTLAVAITATNDAPSGADRTIAIDEDVPHTFTAAEFGFTDPDTGDTLQGVRIDTLPTNGTLTLDGAPVSAGVTIPAGQISDLVFTPAANHTGSPGASFTFSVQDDSGAMGQDYDTTPNTLTFNIAPLNDAPGFADLDATPTHIEGSAVTV
ncbi:DUF4347 domain-containing protein, partial [Actibacterium sp. 188UL27-1]|uniref:DUF4347 domain-containing protein n=1 Tax=Actibacterium sp. 188UL27-1 TaxID=2786961 RepID=UPI001959071E